MIQHQPVFSILYINSFDTPSQIQPIQLYTKLILFIHSNAEIRLTLWGRRAAEFSIDSIYNEEQAKPVVVLIVGSLMKTYAGNHTTTHNNNNSFTMKNQHSHFVRFNRSRIFEREYRMSLVFQSHNSWSWTILHRVSTTKTAPYHSMTILCHSLLYFSLKYYCIFTNKYPYTGFTISAYQSSISLLPHNKQLHCEHHFTSKTNISAIYKQWIHMTSRYAIFNLSL